MLTRWQLWGLVALAFVAGVLGIRAKWMADGEEKLRAKIEQKRQQAIEEARDVRDEVEALDRDTLQRRAAKWVRNPKR